jgi:hypothetical protein
VAGVLELLSYDVIGIEKIPASIEATARSLKAPTVEPKN